MKTLILAAFLVVALAGSTCGEGAAPIPAVATPPPVVQVIPEVPNSPASGEPGQVYSLSLRPTSAFLQTISQAINKLPMITTLILLVGIDILMGSAVAFTQKKVSSTISWRGMVRKGGTFLIVGMAAAIEPYAGLPLAKLMCIFFVYTEAISIVEAAAALGIPLPPQLLAALVKLRDADKAAIITPTPPPSAPAVIVHARAVSVRSPAGQTQKIDVIGGDAGTGRDDTLSANSASVISGPSTPPPNPPQT